MNLPDHDQFREATRQDGWTPELKARFLALLAENGNVRLCARRCGLSAQSAYVQRRRDAVFARGWDGALWLARDHAEQVLADRAIDGIPEEIWHKGELVGTRRRYDSRLLLAHLARLDRQAGDKAMQADAARFDEIVALVAGAEMPESLDVDEDGLPLPCAAQAAQAAEDAESAVSDSMPDPEGKAEWQAYDAAVIAAGAAARDAIEADWERWLEAVDSAVDRVTAGIAPASIAPAGIAPAGIALDGVNVSTSGG